MMRLITIASVSGGHRDRVGRDLGDLPGQVFGAREVVGAAPGPNVVDQHNPHSTQTPMTGESPCKCVILRPYPTQYCECCVSRRGVQCRRWRRRSSGARLRRLREERGLTQVALARALELSTSYVNQLENDQRPITVPVLLALTERFDLPAHYFAPDSDARLVADLSDVFTADRGRRRRQRAQIEELVARMPDGRADPGRPAPPAARRHRRTRGATHRTRRPRRRCRRSARCRSKRSATSSTTARTTSANSTWRPRRLFVDTRNDVGRLRRPARRR